MTIIERAKQYLNGLISRQELQRSLDIENMGSDTRYITLPELIKDAKGSTSSTTLTKNC